MFREMRRYKQAVTAETCAEILKTEKRGVLSVIGDGGIRMPFRWIFTMRKRNR